MAELNDVVALVTGASRGAGRGIALELGAAGATVYVTGRSVDDSQTTDDVPGTIDESARDVTERGGHGIAVPCDHTVDADVESLFARISRDHGRLDVLVNNVWGTSTGRSRRPFGCQRVPNRSLPGCRLTMCTAVGGRCDDEPPRPKPDRWTGAISKGGKR